MSPGQRVGRPPQITFAEVVQAAVEQCREGSVGLSTVARRLGVTPSALYRFVPTADALSAAAADHLLGRLEPPEGEEGLPWQERVRRSSRAAYELLLEYPGLLENRSTTGNSIRGWERTMRMMVEAGLSPQEALDLVVMVSMYLMKSAEMAHLMRSADVSQFAQAVAESGVPVSPEAAAVLRETARNNWDEQLERNIEWLIQRTTAWLAERAGGAS